MPANGRRPTGLPGCLAGMRVVEIGDEQGEYCGLTLAGLGADVVKIEPPGGSTTRDIGPFVDDVPDRERSLYFWAYNRGKRSVVLDLDAPEGAERFAHLLATADVLLDSTTGDALPRHGFGADALTTRWPHLVVARLTPFGDRGPWANHRASDLVHLALGGPLMNCGYDPDPFGHYDLPPMAPQAFQAYHIVGEQLTYGIVAALIYRQRSGRGQRIDCAVHDAVAKCTETDLMSWIVNRQPWFRQTCRHAGPKVTDQQTIVHTKDGRWINTVSVSARDRRNLMPFLERYGMAEDEPTVVEDDEVGARAIPGTSSATTANVELIQRLVRRFTYDEVPWQDAQEAGLMWAPLRKPHENALDDHWHVRGTFTDIEHPELGRTVRYPTSKWIATASAWQPGRPAPRVGEHTDALATEVREPVRLPAQPARPDERRSVHGKPFALDGIRIFDFTWFLASAGGTRFLAALGADVVKVEWKQHPDTRGGGFPAGGREARRAASSPLAAQDGNLGPQFNNKNPGKRGISLNVGHPKGKEIAEEFIRQSDIVAEGFSPGVMDRWGLGWEALRALRPDVIYAQQSGMGARGNYGRFRAVGPIAASLAGLSEMGGMPEPAQPTGWGYSYLDWLGAYSFATAILGAIHQRNATGEAQWIDASQTEVGIATTALSILDWSVNHRPWTRTGNRSPYKLAAPQGVYRCAGDDCWVAISCFTDDDFARLARTADHAEWIDDPRFSSVASRWQHHDELDRLVEAWTVDRDRYEVMELVQRAGVAAGVAQTAEDRCDNDPQLAALDWLTEVPNTEIGTWPVAELPFTMSETPPHVGGHIDKGAPHYGEHNYDVFAEFLGLSAAEVDALADDGVV